MSVRGFCALLFCPRSWVALYFLVLSPVMCSASPTLWMPAWTCSLISCAACAMERVMTASERHRCSTTPATRARRLSYGTNVGF
jgi:hypothetical protein